MYFSLTVFQLFSCWHCQIKNKQTNNKSFTLPLLLECLSDKMAILVFQKSGKISAHNRLAMAILQKQTGSSGEKYISNLENKCTIGQIVHHCSIRTGICLPSASCEYIPPSLKWMPAGLDLLQMWSCELVCDGIDGTVKLEAPDVCHDIMESTVIIQDANECYDWAFTSKKQKTYNNVFKKKIITRHWIFNYGCQWVNGTMTFTILQSTEQKKELNTSTKVTWHNVDDIGFRVIWLLSPFRKFLSLYFDTPRNAKVMILTSTETIFCHEV